MILKREHKFAMIVVLLYYEYMKKSEASVVIPSNVKPPPEEHEVSAAWILARHYSCIITFLPKLEGYKLKSPDFSMHSLVWELKSPSGNAKRTIRNNIDLAKLQSGNIIIDARRTVLPDEWIEAELRKQCDIKKNILRLLMVTKDKKILVIKR